MPCPGGCDRKPARGPALRVREPAPLVREPAPRSWRLDLDDRGAGGSRADRGSLSRPCGLGAPVEFDIGGGVHRLLAQGYMFLDPPTPQAQPHGHADGHHGHRNGEGQPDDHIRRGRQGGRQGRPQRGGQRGGREPEQRPRSCVGPTTGLSPNSLATSVEEHAAGGGTVSGFVAGTCLQVVLRVVGRVSGVEVRNLAGGSGRS